MAAKGSSRTTIDDDTVKLYIGGIDPQWTSDKIVEILSQHGKVKRADIVKNFAFAFVENQKSAESIIKELNGQNVNNHKIVIQISKNKQNLPECDDLCFECGKPGHWAKECSQRRARMARRGGPTSRGFPPRDHAPYGREYPPERYPPVRERDPFSRDPYSRDPYSRDPYARDPYSRDPYNREQYTRDAYSREPYGYPSTRNYSVDYDRYDPRSYSSAGSYRDRSPPPGYAYRRGSPPPMRSAYGREADPYAAARERLAYGRGSYGDSASARSNDPVAARRLDPYDVARRAVDTYDAIRRGDLYEGAPATRSVDPYDVATSRDRYATDSAAKRFPEPAYAPRSRPE